MAFIVILVAEVGVALLAVSTGSFAGMAACSLVLMSLFWAANWGWRAIAGEARKRPRSAALAVVALSCFAGLAVLDGIAVTAQFRQPDSLNAWFAVTLAVHVVLVVVAVRVVHRESDLPFPGFDDATKPPSFAHPVSIDGRAFGSPLPRLGPLVGAALPDTMRILISAILAPGLSVLARFYVYFVVSTAG